MTTEKATLYAGPADGQEVLLSIEQREFRLPIPQEINLTGQVHSISKATITYARCPVLSLQFDKPVFRFVPNPHPQDLKA